MSRKKVFLLCGFPGSGKSTWSRDQVQYGAIIVDQDSIRRMIHSQYVFDEKKEPVVESMSHACLRVALENTDYVIVDETFLTAESRDKVICEVGKFTRDHDIYVLVFPETGDNLKYRMHDARGYTKDQWADVLEKLKNKFEAPNIYEEEIDFLYKMPLDLDKRKNIMQL
jgi:tRNA uridine 5-carbamoylmethylation protein Kti12